MDLDWKLITLIKSVPLQQTTLLFGVSIGRHSTGQSEVQIIQSTSMMTVYDWSEYICLWQMSLWHWRLLWQAQRWLRIIDSGIKEEGNSGEESQRVIKQTSWHAWCISGIVMSTMDGLWVPIAQFCGCTAAVINAIQSTDNFPITIPFFSSSKSKKFHLRSSVCVSVVIVHQ